MVQGDLTIKVPEQMVETHILDLAQNHIILLQKVVVLVMEIQTLVLVLLVDLVVELIMDHQILIMVAVQHNLHKIQENLG